MPEKKAQPFAFNQMIKWQTSIMYLICITVLQPDKKQKRTVPREALIKSARYRC